MRIITKADTKTLYQKALEVAEKYQNQSGNLIIKQFKTSIEFIFIDRLNNTVEFFKVDNHDEATYHGSAITQQSLDAFERFFGKDELEKFVFSIVQAKLNNF